MRAYEGAERRSETRFQISAFTEYQRSGSVGNGTAIDLSRSGVKIENPSLPVSQGDRLGMRFSIFAGSFGVAFTADVVWSIDGLFGAKFIGLGEAQRAVLTRGLPLLARS